MVVGIITISGCSSSVIPENNPSVDQKTEFMPSKVSYDISEETGKPDQYYCSYDESRNKVTIIIKKNGVYDNFQTVSKLNEYFVAVKNHLNLYDAGVKKFSGSTISQFDGFIEDLVKNENVGYIILVGADLPIVKTTENKLMLDFGTINEIYSYVERKREVGLNECADVAISTIVSPQILTSQEKNDFVQKVFNNFINYHKNTEEIFKEFQNTLVIDWDDNLDESVGMHLGEPLNPNKFSDYRNIYFYPTTYILNTEFGKMKNELKKKPLILMYHIHGSENTLGFGLNGKQMSFNDIYTTPSEILDLYNQQGHISLFTNVDAACGQQWLSDRESKFCCWPQTWLKTGVWTVLDVVGDPYHNTFERSLFKEKIVGKALRKTFHSQSMLYGDILGVVP
ncbi:hypothetical protein HY837_06265 [archaeon]|nr:hypothetical protein [archaeon]